MAILLRGGTVVTATGVAQQDVLLDGETIARVAHGIEAPGAEVIDCTARHLLPGGIDVHTHLDMPLGDIASADDFYTGHVAAAFGGTTTHLDFANQAHGESLHATLDAWHERARDRAIIDYGFHVTLTDVTPRTLDEIGDLPARGVTTVKMLMAYKGRVMVDDTSLFLAMERARDHGLLTMVHCENGDIIDILIRHALARGETSPRFHATTRPPQLEGEATGRAIAMSQVLDAPLYVVHVTCRESLARIREARAAGSNVHAETCPQYLVFTRDDLERPRFEGAKWVCSPPFRERADQEALWHALEDDTLQVVSTDHCPFPFEGGKTRGRHDFSLIPNGIPAIEHRLPLLYTLGVAGGRIDLPRFVSLTATEPARLFGLSHRKGIIAPGLDADLAIWNFDRERTVTLATTHSAVDYTPFEGMTLRGVPEKVFRRGELLVDEDRFLGRTGSGRFMARERGVSLARR